MSLEASGSRSGRSWRCAACVLALVASCGGVVEPVGFLGSGGGATAASSGGGATLEPCASSADCHALDGPCTQGLCVEGACASGPANDFGVCDDGAFCSETDLCVSGLCVPGAPRLCPSSDPCHLGTCFEAADACGVVELAEGAACDDLDACTGHGTCTAGVCAGGATVDCSPLDDACSVGVCDPASGCVAQPAHEGDSCGPGGIDPCVAGQCAAGACVQGPANEGGPCDDGAFCTINEACHGGVCDGGLAAACADPGGCFVGTCDEANDKCQSVPGNDGAACDDGSACTVGSVCAGGACAGGSPANDGAACDDGASCTAGEICAGGVCAGGAGPVVYLADDFSDNALGWTLDAEWQIGSALASTGGVFGEDPATDHSPTSDNGVAGVVLGGHAEKVLHGFYHLTSPAFDATGGAPVILGFYRWLSADYDPFMHSHIEVFDGARWMPVWVTGGQPIEDAPRVGQGWTYIQHDLTPFASAAMRVRFGFDVASEGVFDVGSWNIDDVLVAGAACP